MSSFRAPQVILFSDDLRHGFVPCDPGAPAAIAELLELPNSSLLAVGEAGAERIEVTRLFANAAPPEPTARR